MQTEPKRSSGLRLKRMLFDEWAMIALLGAAVVQTGFAVSAMNGVVRSADQVSLAPQAQQAVADQSPLRDAAPSKDSLALVTPQKQQHSDF